MTEYIQSNRTTEYGTTASYQTTVLVEGVSIKSATGHGIFNSGAYKHNTIEVNGLIEAKGQYKSGVVSDADFTTIKVSTTGDITGNNGIVVHGNDAAISNAGHLNGYNIGIYAKGTNEIIQNSGSIVGNTGLYLDEGSVFEFTNTKVVSGTVGMKIESSQGKIVNADLAGINGTDTAIQIDSVEGGGVVIDNDGGIASQGYAIHGGTGVEQVTNTGYIKGKISLGGGGDSFDNRGGVIDHAIDGGDGNDFYYLGSTADKIIDSSGFDTVVSDFSTTLKNYASIERLQLTGGNINGTGNALVNVIHGSTGNNVLDGGADNLADSLVGGAGNDTYVLGSGTDFITDTSGVDTITSTITRSLGGFSAIENLKLLGSANINGTGNGLNNAITGNTGNNTLNGAAGKDILTGGTGADKLTGGDGADTFVFKTAADSTVATTGRDTIYDFSHSQGDHFDLSAIDAKLDVTGNNAFSFKGTAAFTGHDGELRYVTSASDTYIYGDINGDKMADFAIHLDDKISLQASDFIL